MSDWKPEPGTYWLDRFGDVWTMCADGRLRGTADHTGAGLRPWAVLGMEGPLRRLEPTDEVVGDE